MRSSTSPIRRFLIYDRSSSLAPDPPLAPCSGPRCQLFQYNGSTSDVASSNTLASAVPEVPQKSNPGKGKSNGKGKGKSNGKGKGKAAEVIDDFAATVLDEVEENVFDGGEIVSSVKKRPSFLMLASSVGNGGAPNGETGHAMLKSRLTRVSLRGLSQVDDGAVVVSNRLNRSP